MTTGERAQLVMLAAVETPQLGHDVGFQFGSDAAGMHCHSTNFLRAVAPVERGREKNISHGALLSDKRLMGCVLDSWGRPNQRSNRGDLLSVCNHNIEFSVMQVESSIGVNILWPGFKEIGAVSLSMACE